MTARFVSLTPELLFVALTLAADPHSRRIPQVLPRYADSVLAPGAIAYATIDGGYLLAAGGVIPLWPGLYEGWAIVTSLANRRHLVDLTRQTRVFFDTLMESGQARRLQLYIAAAAPWRESFAAGLGLTEAHGPLEAWGIDGEPYYLHARTGDHR